MAKLEFPDPNVENPTITGGYTWWWDGQAWVRQEPTGSGGCQCKPRTDSVVPNQIEVEETRDLVITGENFFSAYTTVTVPGATVNSVQFTGTTQMTVNVTTGTVPVSQGDIVVKNQEAEAYGTPLKIDVDPDALKFVLVLKASSASDEVILPLVSGYNYNFNIDWGDGTPIQTITSSTDPNKSHYYPDNQEYTVIIDGLCEAWSFSNFTNWFSNKVIKVLSLGQMGWKNLHRAFYYNNYLTEFNCNNGDVTGVTDFTELLASCGSLTSVDLTGMDFTNVTSLYRWFHGADIVNLTFPASAAATTGNITNLQELFAGCDKLQTVDFSNLNSPLVTTMQAMFSGCPALIDPDLENLDMTSCTSVHKFFEGGGFNGATVTGAMLAGWDTSNVQNFSYMFYQNKRVVDADLSGLNMSSATSMQWMFEDCALLETVSLPQINLTASGYATFRDCWKLHTIDVAAGSNWNITNGQFMFQQCADLVNFDPSWLTVTNCTDMTSMFNYCLDLLSLDLSHWNTSNVTQMDGMFNDCINIHTINTAGWDTSNVTTMASMFADCQSLVNLDVDHFNIENVTIMTGFFYKYNGTVPWPAAKYDAALNAWALQTVQPNLTLSVSTNYTAAGAASRAVLAGAPNNWTINDSGQI